MNKYANKLRVGIIGIGMVGQPFITLLHDHPWFQITAVAASSRSAGKTVRQALEGRWAMPEPLPESVANIIVQNAADVADIASKVDVVFCAVDMPKDETRALEEAYARAEIPVVSNNSACRKLTDVPMLIPEINSAHLEVIDAQRARLGTKRGFIVVKPNCSIQSYVPVLHPLLSFGVEKVMACTYQAISGAGKTFETYPEILDNVIPFISGEEEKSEQEPLKIWGSVKNGEIVSAEAPIISAQCLRVPALHGHMAAVSVKFTRKPTEQQMKDAWAAFSAEPQALDLPSAPKQFLRYMDDEFRPQTRLDRDYERGMGVSIGRLRPDAIFDYRFVALSHNTMRGAAGGGVLTGELLRAKGLI